jgi:transposase-like protein
VAQEAKRLAEMGLSPLEIARRLGVAKSTVTRWMAAGKLARGKGGRKTSAPPLAPAQWAKTVREAYALDATDEQLVTCAQQALEVSYNMAETPTTRMNAMGRFQAIVKQLALVARLAEDEQPKEPEKPVRRPFVPRSGIDPRNVLQAVK